MNQEQTLNHVMSEDEGRLSHNESVMRCEIIRLRDAIAKVTTARKVETAIDGRIKALELQVDLLYGVVEQLAAACEEAASFYATMMGENALAEDMPLLMAAIRMIRATGPRESSHSTPQGDIEGAPV